MKAINPVNQCVYCGDLTGPFSKEHIIPKGLAGTWTLPKSSCEKCAAITSEFELKCLRGMFGGLRTHLEFPTRRKSQRPTELPVWIENDKGVNQVDTPIPDHPHLLILPEFSIPQCFTGQVSKETKLRYRFLNYLPDAGKRVENLSEDGKVQMRNLMPIPAFIRLLAKVGHCFAVGEFGVDTFEHFLPDIILGKGDKIPFEWIGGYPDNYPAFELPDIKITHKQAEDGSAIIVKEGQAHQFQFLLASTGKISVQPLLMVAIRLFAILKAAPYLVVVGTCKDNFPFEKVPNLSRPIERLLIGLTGFEPTSSF
ncbi:MAG: hypothetical protein P1V20_28375 [Verrucomicrobiales bacterium]|nr:hypothetical protein [Verrucomicrobiales bacterium]